MAAMQPARRAMIAMLIGVLVWCAVAAVRSPNAAAAGLLDVTCPGYQTLTYDPGLTLTPKRTRITTLQSYTPCVSSDPTLTSGSLRTTVHDEISCLTAEDSGSGSYPLAWNNGRTSTFVFTRSTNRVAGQSIVRRVGTISAGQFAGDTAVLVLTSPTLDLLGCLTPQGVTSQAGPLVLEITALRSVPEQDPVAADDAYRLLQGGRLSVGAPGVLANDSDPEKETLQALPSGLPRHGALALQPDGSFSYTPNRGFSGRDTFAYRAVDGAGGSKPASVTLQVASRSCEGRRARTVGTINRDTLAGSARADIIAGVDGDDSLAGRGGADRVCGGNGKDRIEPGAGRDLVSGGAGNDTVFARDGERDRVDCGRGKDLAVVDKRDGVHRCERVRRR